MLAVEEPGYDFRSSESLTRSDSACGGRPARLPSLPSVTPACIIVRMMRGLVLVTVAATAAFAQPKANVPPLVGASELAKLTAATGFIDDPIATDDRRIAYVVADAAAVCELHVVTLATKAETVTDLSKVTLHPVGLELVGDRAFVIGATEDGNQTAALVEIAPGKGRSGVVYKLPPATHIAVITREGKKRVAVHRATASQAGTRHEIDLVALETGKRLGGSRIELDASGTDKQLELKVNHWSDGMTRAHGIKGGEWDKKENQRSPDQEATFDLVTGKLVDRTPIADLFEQRKRFGVLADAGGKLDFARMLPDNTAIQIWTAGKPHSLELDQPLGIYEPKSLQAIVAPDGSAWLALKVDPVNPDAVARKKADPEYLDVFRAGSNGKAVRKARVLATGVKHRFGITGDKLWLLELSPGSDRGGRNLVIYQMP